MLSSTLRIILAFVIIVYFVIIFMFLKFKTISLKYSLLWIFAGIVLLILVAFPKILGPIMHLFGIYNETNGLFTFLIGFVIMILMSITSIVSKQKKQITRLTQSVSLLDEKVRKLTEEKEAK